MTTIDLQDKVLQQAVTLAELAGEKYSQPGLAMAEILQPLNVDKDTLAAAIIYNSALYADLDAEDITEHLGTNVSALIQHAKQMEGISELYETVAHHEHHHPKVDVIRKMLLAMVNDVRAVLIKLAEQLVKLRAAKQLPESRQQHLAQEVRAIYAPLANRLGIGNIKWEMEDLAFRYLESASYKQISQHLNQRRVDREGYVKNLIKTLTSLLQQAGIKDMEVTGRVKHIYSIYRKMQRKNVDFAEIYDATALRVMVPTIEDCYTVLSNVHAVWQNIPEEFDDYLTNPKPNGYRSIHTAVIGPDNKNVEIQIRTYQMHEEAELGMAAHWIYKEGPQKSSDYESKIAWLRQVMDWQEEIATSEVEAIFADRVYVFTPKGEVIDLPQGATVLDFAYQIHSEVGHRCRGAKVSGDIVNLTYQLKTGDAIEILTGKELRPSRDWLNPHLGFLLTSRARAKVQSWFRKQDVDKNEIKTSNTANLLPKETEAEIALVPIKKPSGNKLTDIAIQGIDNLLTYIANCCQPVPGDAIVGYITQGKGVSIHRQDCFNILRTQAEKPERLLEVSWGAKAVSRYPINLIIEAYDRSGLIKDITNILTNETVALLGLNCGVDKKEAMAFINLTVEITNLALLEQVITKLKQLSDIVTVRRV